MLPDKWCCPISDAARINRMYLIAMIFPWMSDQSISVARLEIIKQCQINWADLTTQYLQPINIEYIQLVYNINIYHNYRTYLECTLKHVCIICMLYWQYTRGFSQNWKISTYCPVLCEGRSTSAMNLHVHLHDRFEAILMPSYIWYRVLYLHESTRYRYQF